MRRPWRVVALVIVIGLALGGCSPAERAWHEATKANTLHAYRDYGKQYPGHHVVELETREWALVESLASPLTYLDFYRDHPASTRILVRPGTASWAFRFSQDPNGLVSIASMTFEVDGAPFPVSDAEASVLHLNRGPGTMGVYSNAAMPVKVVRRRSDGKVLTVVTGE